MKCPNCSSSMFIADKTAQGRSLVTFFRCTTCIGEHVSSELINDDQDFPSSRLEFFETDLIQEHKPSLIL
jgi:hypothetical protein